MFKVFFFRKLKECEFQGKLCSTFAHQMCVDFLYNSLVDPCWKRRIRENTLGVYRLKLRASLQSLSPIYEFQLHKKALDIVRDDSHPASYEEMPSGRRYRKLCFKCESFKRRWLPRAVQYLWHFKVPVCQACCLNLYMVFCVFSITCYIYMLHRHQFLKTFAVMVTKLSQLNVSYICKTYSTAL